MSDHILDRLFALLKQRKTADAESSYVARLYKEGTAKCAQKFGEEAVETVIEAMKVEAGNMAARTTLAEESADAIFHLMVVWSQLGLDPDEVWAVLEKRFGKHDERMGAQVRT